MKARILSAILMLPLLLIVYLGGKVLLAGCFVIGVMGVREFFGGFRKIGANPSNPIAYGSAVALYLIDLLGAGMYMHWFFGVILASLLYLFRSPAVKAEDAAITLTGIFYVIFFSYHVALTDHYHISVWLIFISAFGTDMAAYFTGHAIGKHKLCPEISPKKTVEGAIGGVLGSVILCGIFGYCFIRGLFIHCLIIGAIGSVAAQTGDLIASAFKRKMGIKDYGNLIPGHGGVMDRFDSVLLTAPLVYYYMSIYIIYAVVY